MLHTKKIYIVETPICKRRITCACMITYTYVMRVCACVRAPVRASASKQMILSHAQFCCSTSHQILNSCRICTTAEQSKNRTNLLKATCGIYHSPFQMPQTLVEIYMETFQTLQRTRNHVSLAGVAREKNKKTCKILQLLRNSYREGSSFVLRVDIVSEYYTLRFSMNRCQQSAPHRSQVDLQIACGRWQTLAGVCRWYCLSEK